MLPTEMSVQLKYCLNTSVVAATTLQSQYFGFFEFLNRKPQFSDQMFTLYRLARVVQVKVQMQVVNTGTAPIDIVMCPMSYSDSTASSIIEARDNPRSVYKLVAGVAGTSKSTITRVFDATDLYGNDVTSESSRYMTLSSSSNTAPANTNDPVANCLTMAADGTSAYSCLISYSVFYQVRYFDIILQTPS